MTISLFVAAAENDVIGRRGTLLPWHLRADLMRFKELTTGHPIIMGRKTYQTIGRPLPGRHNIIISRNTDYKAEGCSVVGSLGEALKLAAADGTDEAFVSGGGTIYEQALPIADKIYFTRVHASPAGDVRFRFDLGEWREESREEHPADNLNDHAFTWLTLVRR
jgi:dihydrofolate reductase